MHSLPQVAGLRVSGDDIAGGHGAAGSPELCFQAACNSGAAGMQRLPTSASVLAADGGKMDSVNDRRPLTAEGSSVYATALRQLEREQMQQV